MPLAPRISIFLVLFLIGIPVMGASLDDYRQRVAEAAVQVDSLLGTTRASGTRDLALERSIIADIHRLLPATEKVEWKGGSIDTANDWLFAELDAFSDQTDKVKRATILNSISERLGAIVHSVDELNASVNSSRTKDDDKQKLAEILKRIEYQKAEQKEESLFQKWVREFQEWLSSVFPSMPRMSSESSAGIGSLKLWLQVLVFVAVLGLIGFLLYKFVPSISTRFGPKKKSGGDRVILGERISADESAHDLFDEAERLAREGNLRGAIRKGYIALLCELSDRKVIGLARHKTNRDYLRDVRKRSDLFENMSGMTVNFERNWYGLHAAETADWEDFRDRYRRTIADVKAN